MRLVFGDSEMKSALLTKMMRDLNFGSDCPLMTVRNFLFDNKYQLSRCLSDKKGGHSSEVSTNQSVISSVIDVTYRNFLLQHINHLGQCDALFAQESHPRDLHSHRGSS